MTTASQSLSIASGSAENENLTNPEEDELGNKNDSSTATGTPLDQRILEIVKSCPTTTSHSKSSPPTSSLSSSYTIKPARLSAELGMSVEDATAELCGLLAAVGGGHDGASFTFETTTADSNSSGHKVTTMVFTFPNDFEQRAKRNRRKEDFKQWCWDAFYVFLKALKIITAFGLILSLCILTIAAVIGIGVAIVAMSTNNQGNNSSHHHRTLLFRQLRIMCYTMRQSLFIFSLFGPSVEGQDPFLAEISYDLFLLSSVCCGSPGNFFWWYRVQQLNRRRRRARRGWGRGLWNVTSTGSDELESDVAGVRLVRRGEWGQEPQRQRQQQEAINSDEHRGILSIAVEYLFGPSPFQPGPTETEIWKLRAAAIVQISAHQFEKGEASSGVSLHQLSPYMDNPPSSIDQDVPTIVAGGLQIVTHFNGIPVAKTDKDSEGSSLSEPHKARFHFPELLAESQYATRYEGNSAEDDDEDESWGSLLCARSSTSVLGWTALRTGESSAEVPAYLVERRHRFTKLQSTQFFYCVSLGVINLIGVIWLRKSLEPPNGMLQLKDGTLMATIIKGGLMRVMFFYAILFFALPVGRLVVIVFLNSRRRTRNQRRKEMASSLQS